MNIAQLKSQVAKLMKAEHSAELGAVAKTEMSVYMLDNISFAFNEEDATRKDEFLVVELFGKVTNEMKLDDGIYYIDASFLRSGGDGWKVDTYVEIVDGALTDDNADLEYEINMRVNAKKIISDIAASKNSVLDENGLHVINYSDCINEDMKLYTKAQWRSKVTLEQTSCFEIGVA